MDALQFLHLSPAAAISSLLAVTALVLLYFAALPKPFPGIPHNNTHRSILGDVPALLKFVRQDKEYLNFFYLQTKQLNSRVIQLFLKPFGSPMIIVNDFREADDLLTRRSGSLEVSELRVQIFASAVAKSTIAMPTHALFKSQRRLWAGTMAPEFINRVIAPRLFTAGEELVELWIEKTKRANGAAFKGNNDLRFCALDAIWAAAMGSAMGTLATQIDGIKGTPASSPQSDGSVEFEGFHQPELAEAVDIVLEGMSQVEAMVVRRFYNFIQQFIPRYRKAYLIKEKAMRQLLKESRARFSGPDFASHKPTCAMEQVLQREATMVEKAGYVEAASDDNMVDELFLWLAAGHETTAVSLGWGLKALAENVPVQQKLREILRDGLGKSHAASAEEILAIDAPYLDAVLYEILRISRTTNGISRIATEDIMVLGHLVPKGSHLFLATNGFTALNDHPPPYSPESSRSTSSQQANKVNDWDPATIRSFDPDRWLKNVDGKTVFDSDAGPWMPFGGGPRGCFGKRLAMVELKIFLTQLMTNFEFLPVLDSLNSYAATDRITRVPFQCYVRPRIV